ncbi:hypothetical protein GDO86_007351 [Hymenochirus boettgeri]|uniref:RING-type domain-containing protein n=1 Tax=Hymenochirus boettgeri TaxID=247094 RepID=A0A8T2ITC4_9PIPI|nr:hypothetical protein GDO86_007351 [Hymenochirus boettgeri]
MPIRAYCTICSDFFDNVRDVAAITCGHTFHQHCLSQWFHSAPQRTCPQCRIQVSNRQIINKLFFDVGGEEESILDPESLKNEVDRIKVSLLAKEKEKRECQTLVDSLRDMLDIRNATIQSLQKDLGDMEMLCSTLKKQIKFLDQQQCESKAAKDEARKLRSKLKAMEKEYENLKELQRSSVEMTEKLRKDLFLSNNKAQKAELELAKAREELGGTQKELHNADKEIMSLRKRVEFLQKSLSTPTAANEAISRLIFESPAPIGIERPKIRPPLLGSDINLDVTFDIDTPEHSTQKTVAAPFKKMKLDKKEYITSPNKNSQQEAKTSTSWRGVQTGSDEDDLPLPSFIKNSLLHRKPVGSLLNLRQNTGVVCIGLPV